MSIHTNQSRTVCENSVGDGCSFCATSLYRPPRSVEDGMHGPSHQSFVADLRDCQGRSLECEVRGGSRLPLVSVVAFVLPLVVVVAVVQCVEIYVGSALAAIAGVVAAGLVTMTSAGMMKFLTRRSGVTGAGR